MLKIDEIDFDIDIDFFNKVKAKTGDNSRCILFTLFSNGLIFNLSDKTVRCYAKKIDNTICFVDLTTIDAENGKALLQLSNQMLAIKGKQKMELVILDGTDILSSTLFTLEVVESLNTEGVVESSNEYKSLIDALGKVDLWEGIYERTNGALELKYTTRLNDVAYDINKLKSYLNNLNSNITNKRNNDTPINMNDLATDVKEAMTGGSVAVVGTDSVGQENLKSGALEYFRHNKSNYYPLLLKSNPKNLFNKNTAIDGYYVVRNTGELAENSSYSASDYIPVAAGSYYVKNNTEQLAFYDSNKAYVSGLPSTTTSGFQVPDGAYYARICCPTKDKDKLQFESGTSSTDYQPYVTDLKLDIQDYFNKFSVNMLKDINNIELGIIDGNLEVDTISKTVKIYSTVVFSTNNWYNTHSVTLTYTTNSAVMILFSKETSSFMLLEDKADLINTTNLLLIGIIYNNNIYNTLSKYTVNGRGNSKEQEVYTLKKCYMDWLGGLKSPIVFLGDSTIDGDTTTSNTVNIIGQDIQDPNTFTTKLQELLREETGNNTLRIYNAGFSGKQADWAYNNITSIMEPFKDSKIVLIGYGINDRKTDYYTYYKDFYERIENLINWCLNNGYQPILLTTQAICENYLDTTATASRTKESVNTCANTVKKELAKKYNLELIDVNYFTNKFLLYSQYSQSQISADGLHFGDVGHQYEAGLFFKEIVPRVIEVKGDTLISLLHQNSKSNVNYNFYASGDKFKDIFCFTREETTELTLQDVWIFNNTNKQIKIVCTGNADIYLDNNLNTCTGTLEIDNVELGLHHIVVKTTSKNVDWSGIECIV